MRIMLIAGHGGTPYDSGASGFGYKEAVETRRMATAVAPMLRNYGFDVVMYDQSKDAFKVVTQGDVLPLAGVDYVLEFHMNAAAQDYKGNGRTTGSEIWVHNSESATGAENAILKRLQSLGFKNRGVKRTGRFAVLRHVKRRGVSHALIETCFIDDKDDMDLYKDKFYDIARAIADGVAEGFGKTVRQEDAEMVEKKEVMIHGKPYVCECIEKSGQNYVKMRSLAQAGFDVDFDAVRKVPIITAPDCRAFVHDPDEKQQTAIDKVKEFCGIEQKTIDFMRRYKFGDTLIEKIADALRG